MYQILYWPHPMLREVAEDVTDFVEAEQIIEGLFETMYADRGIGLAATQVGILKRIFVADAGLDKMYFINPKIIEREGTITNMEGCLSFPGVFAPIERAESITLQYTMLTGEVEERIMYGTEAQCAQHELDHLNGIVFFDYLKKTKRMMLESKLRKKLKKVRK